AELTGCPHHSSGTHTSSDGAKTASSQSGQTSAGTGQALTPADPSKRTGQELGKTGASVKTVEAPALVTTLLAKRLPSAVLLWLQQWSKNGWQAVPPSLTGSLREEMKPVMREIYSVWAPATAADAPELVAEIMATLSVYGYGALPSDPAQCEAKVR